MSSRPAPGALWRPAILVMRRLRLQAKIALLTTLLAIPLLILLTRSLLDQQAQLGFVRDEVAGAQVVSALLDVAVQAQTHRGQTNMALSGHAGAAQALPGTRQRLKTALDEADHLLAAHPEWNLASQWSPVRDGLQTLAGGAAGERAALFRAHTEQIQALRALVSLLGERSQLLFDPEAPTFFLMDLAVERALPLTEQTGLLRGQGAGLLARGEATPAELAAVQGRLASLNEHLQGVQTRVAALERAGEPAPAGFAPALERGRAFLGRATEAFASGAPQGDAAAYFGAGTQAIEAAVAFTREASSRLTELLGEREARLQRQRNLALAGAVLGLLVLVYAGGGLYLGTQDALLRVARVVRAGSGGDLTRRAEVPGRDEFAVMGGELDAMCTQLSRMIEQIRRHAREVADTGVDLAGTSAGLSDRVAKQAAAVEQSAATLEEIAQTVRSTASHVAHLDQLFAAMQGDAQAGHQQMQRAVQTVEGMAATSRQVGEIVAVIDSIAFQTNILALNAAVEAARAGESGRGFAVVAAEVRTLAQRSATAAGEIRALIEESVRQVDRGVDDIRQVSGHVDRMTHRIDEVGGAVNGLNTSTREQTLAVDQVSAAVRQIGDDTCHSAEDIQQTAHAAQALRGHADALMGLVDQFKAG